MTSPILTVESEPVIPNPYPPTIDVPYSRWYLFTRAAVLRSLASLAFAIHHLYPPSAPSPTLSTYVPSTLSHHKGPNLIRLDIYIPTTPPPANGKRPGVIVFHGGGMVIGSGTDDARWARACMDHLDAVVIGVSYRLAPNYPFPIPVEDSADAILHISTHADEFGIDPDQLFLSGFSAGGNLVFTAFFLLCTPGVWGYPDIPTPRIKGMIAFYPVMDWSIPRETKRAANVRPEMTLPKNLTDLFDMSYLYPPPDPQDPRLNPGIASDELMNRLPPVHLCLCEYDMLLAEGLRLKERLEGLGKTVSCKVVEKEKHGWEKPPDFLKPSMGIEYNAALVEAQGWLERAASE